MADVTDTDRAYAAGLFDGEGCVELFMKHSGFNNKGNVDNSIRAALSITGADQRPLQWLVDHFGGNIKISTHPKKKKQRPVGRWLVTGENADAFADDVHPYLLVKREQIELWMQARSLMYKRGRIRGVKVIPDEEILLRRSIVTECSDLKKIARMPDGSIWQM